MKNRFLLFIAVSFFCISNVYGQTGTFNFETATTSGTPHSVSQTVGSRTVTISSGVDVNVIDPFVDYGMTINGISGKTAINDASTSQNFTITFAGGSVNITTLKVYDGTSSGSSGTMVFVPTGGSNSTVNFTPSPNQWDNNAKTVTLNWVGITAITITAPYDYYWGFDDIVMDGALPVELASFTAIAKGDQVELAWNTATEVNNYGFEIERSEKANGRSEMWVNIGFVEGAGTSYAPQTYSFTDNTATSGTYHYRLKQIDRDGKFAYSNSVEAEVNNDPRFFRLMQNYPNPFNPTTVINYQVPSTKYVILKVYDVLGREAATLVNEEKPAGNYEVTFDASKLSGGIYVARLQFSAKDGKDLVQMKRMLLVK